MTDSDGVALLIAHLSDPHLDPAPGRRERTEAVLAHLRGLTRPVDVLLVTGDVANHAAEAEYAEALELFEPFGALVCPGNHDRRAGFRAGLGPLLAPVRTDGPVHQVQERGGAVFVLLDSTIPGENGGELSAESLSWLDATLTEQAGRTVFLALHHPPLSLGQPYIEKMLLADPGALEAVVARHDCVRAVFGGHAHTAATGTFAGRPLLLAPGVASTASLPWEGGAPLLTDAPVAFAYHLLLSNGRLITHYRYVEHGRGVS
jgi:3',5'-cyclic-AMP phosphodiesterase